jgi:mannose-6-phosphate isomerase-like protein (cupin superfamily)
MKTPANLAEKLATFTDRYSPRTVATYNNNDIMVAKLEGAFHWHKHDETDDFFLVLKGTLDIELRDRGELTPAVILVATDSNGRLSRSVRNRRRP